MNKVDISFIHNRLKLLLIVALALAVSLMVANPAMGQVSQDAEQEVESGDSDQDFNVTGGGDNSNQCAGIQGVTNTGNAQNQIAIEQYESRADDFEFEDVGSTITVDPESSTTCDQEVNQAASASSDASSGSSWSWDGTGWWYWDGMGWWYLDSSGWWYYNSDGSWTHYGWSPASMVTMDTLGGAGGLTTLGVLGTLGLAGTALVIRRARHD